MANRRRVNDTAAKDTNGLISHARSMMAIWGRIFESRAAFENGAATSYLLQEMNFIFSEFCVQDSVSTTNFTTRGQQNDNPTTRRCNNTLLNEPTPP